MNSLRSRVVLTTTIGASSRGEETGSRPAETRTASQRTQPVHETRSETGWGSAGSARTHSSPCRLRDPRRCSRRAASRRPGRSRREARRRRGRPPIRSERACPAEPDRWARGCATTVERRCMPTTHLSADPSSACTAGFVGEAGRSAHRGSACGRRSARAPAAREPAAGCGGSRDDSGHWAPCASARRQVWPAPARVARELRVLRPRARRGREVRRDGREERALGSTRPGASGRDERDRAGSKNSSHVD